MIDIILNSSYMGNVRFDLTVSTSLIALSQSYAAHLHQKPNILRSRKNFIEIITKEKDISYQKSNATSLFTDRRHIFSERT
jgi:hypothetical protein